jgi:hypothetical protein
MSYVEVDPQLVRQAGVRLRDAVAAARVVTGRRGELTGLVADAGHAALTGAVETFLSRWAHGLGCLMDDADRLASMLTDAGRVYVDVETSIASAAGGAVP